MSQSRPSLAKDEQQSPLTPLSKENASDAPSVDNLHSDLDAEPSVARGADLAIPQKREREVSLEPSTPRPDDIEPATHENRSRSPVKKSRALSTPVEVDENDNDEQDGDFVFVDTSDHEDPSPSPQPSPPDELKVRPICEGVEDTVWRNEQDTLQDSRGALPAPTAPPELQSQIGTSSPTSVVTTPELQNQAGIGEASTGDAAAQIGEPTTTASVVPDAAPPPAAVLSVTKEDPAPSSPKPISQSAAEPTHETDGQGSLPSQDEPAHQNADPPETKRPTPPLSEIDGATKRPREDEDSDLDPNPREAKRASPPPEKDKDKEKTEKPARKKSGAGTDLHPLSAPASPRSRPASAFGGGGFLAYAGMGSPFSAVKGPSLFGASSTSTKNTTVSTTTTTTITAPSAATPNMATILTTAPSIPSSPPKTVPSSPVQRAASPTPAKRTGFEAFAAAASPFASAAARARSPVRRSGSPGPGGGPRSNPFASYAAGGAQGLFSASGAPAAKRARGESESGPPGDGGERSSWREGSAGAEKTFGERLRAGSGSGGDEEDEGEGGIWGELASGGKWAEQEVLTGEEEDETVHSVRGKLFMLSEQNQWKERGTGILRLNRRREDRGGARLVMRKDAVYAVMLNVTLFRGMSCSIAQDPRYLRFSVLTSSGTTHYNLRVGSAQAAADLLKAINDNIPHA